MFTNAKIPRALRSSWPLIVHGEEVLWVAGLRRSAAFPIEGEESPGVTVRVEGALPWRPC